MSLAERQAHERFLKRLDGSRPATFRVAEWLHKAGYSINIPAIRYRKFEDKIEDFVDSGDIFVEKDGEKYRVEVKHSGYDFTCAKDWPFPTMFVSNKAAVERNTDVSCYIIINQPMTHLALIWKKTKEHWFVKPAFAKNTQKTEYFYTCPIDNVDFRSIND